MAIPLSALPDPRLEALLESARLVREDPAIAVPAIARLAARTFGLASVVVGLHCARSGEASVAAAHGDAGACSLLFKRATSGAPGVLSVPLRAADDTTIGFLAASGATLRADDL